MSVLFVDFFLSNFSLGSVKGDARRSKAPVPSFRKIKATTPLVSALASAIATTAFVPILVVAPSAPVCVPVLTSAPPLFSLIDEDDKHSPSDRGFQPRKRRYVDMGDKVPLAVDVAKEDFTLRETASIFVNDDVESSLEAPRPVKADVGMSLYSEGRDIEEVSAGGHKLSRKEEASTSRTAMDTSLPTDDRGTSVSEESDKSGSDVDLDDLRMIDEGLNQLEAVTLEIESARREKRHKEIFIRLKRKYTEYRGKYRDLRSRLSKGSDVRALREELKKRDEELVQSIEKCSILEGTLRNGVLSFELSEKADILELANNTCRVERENDQSTARAKKDRLKERIGELEKENSNFHDRVAALEAESSQLLAWPSSSNAFGFPSVPRELYDTAVPREDARVKAREARVTYGYDTAVPRPDKEDGKGGIDRLEEDA
ncbi:uncharacterized protein [Nicotiana sylvestris]|uniref:uncharacterized protein n=1 Tax=Nicotiana sylvestris TaxID=4096 RepID=UPI00388C4E9C